MVFAKTIDGGTGTYLSNLLETKKLLENQINISVAALEEPIYMERSNEEFYYMKQRDYSFDKYSFSFKNIFDFIKEFIWIKKIINNEVPDIILGIDVNCNIHTGLHKLLFRKNFKTIFTTTSDLKGNLEQRSTKFLMIILKKVIGFFYSRSDSLICVSKELSNSLKSFLGINYHIITILNGLEHINTANINSGLSNNIIVTVARLDKQKDHMTLLIAFELIIKDFKNAHLWIVGDGPLKEELKLFVKKRNLDSNVVFWGWRKNLEEIFLKSDVFVLSSRREGFPYALIGAMSFGLPVICTDTPYGPREILNDGKYGFIVPMGGYIELKDAIINLLQNSAVYNKYSHLAYERSRNFTSERMVNEYANEIKRLV